LFYYALSNLSRFLISFLFLAACGGEGGGFWGHPKPWQRTASSALLLWSSMAPEEEGSGCPEPRQRTAFSALLLLSPATTKEEVFGYPKPWQMTAFSALLFHKLPVGAKRVF